MQIKSDFSQNLDVGDRKLEKMYESLIRFLALMRKIMTPMGILLPILRPDMPIFATSLIYSTTSPGPLPRVIYSLPIIYMSLTWWSNVLFMVAWLLGYVFSTLAAMRNLR